MKKSLIIISILIAFVAYFLWPEKVTTYPAGITAPEQPQQVNLATQKQWHKNDYTINALASYNLKARVLSRNSFSLGKETELSPVDLALGWGPMSDQKIIDKITVTQSNRWYHWNTDSLPIPANQISLNSANVHIIPANENIYKKLEDVYKGSLIELSGFLVEVKGKGGWNWKSSLRRDDTGAGSCELFWVEELNLLDPDR